MIQKIYQFDDPLVATGQLSLGVYSRVKAETQDKAHLLMVSVHILVRRQLDAPYFFGYWRQ